MVYLVLGSGFLFILFALIYWVAYASPTALIGSLRWVFVVLAGLILLVTIGTGRWGLAWMAIVGLLPWLSRLNKWSRAYKTMQGSKTGQNSHVRTPLLAMTLDHDTGHMDGEILDGAFKGEKLSSLSEEALITLLKTAHRQFPDSVQLLETYLDRFFTGWRDRNREDYGDAGMNTAPMTRADALKLLKLQEGASTQEIKEAFRKAMKTAHPDHGGSPEKAARLNEARDFLLNS